MIGEYAVQNGASMSDDLIKSPWRCGRKVGRTIYAQIGSEPGEDDLLIGMMDSPELALAVVEAHNDAVSFSRNAESQ